VDLSPSALPLDEAAVPETGQMLGDVRLRQAARGDEITDPPFAALELTQKR
jgi:hypothetical protein